MRPKYDWQIGTRSLQLGPRTLVMGVVNVTPDSFSDAGQFYDRGRAVEHALQLLDEGADIIDIGGESTRPGTRVEVRSGRHAVPLSSEAAWARSTRTVSVQEELTRVMPVLTELKRLRPNAIVSVDTYKASVARAACDNGADIINDVSGFLWDSDMPATLAQLPCGVVLMHVRGKPEEWRNLPPVDDVVGLVKRELKDRLTLVERCGIARNRVVLDPGIGFGKNYEQNYPLLSRLGELAELGFPLLTATSRKSFVGKAIAGDHKMPLPADRLYGSLAAMVITIMNGAHVVRVHDVNASIDAARVADAILNA